MIVLMNKIQKKLIKLDWRDAEDNPHIKKMEVTFPTHRGDGIGQVVYCA